MIDVLPRGTPGSRSKTAMLYPVSVSRRADQMASSKASAPWRRNVPEAVPGTGRFAVVMTLAGLWSLYCCRALEAGIEFASSLQLTSCSI